MKRALAAGAATLGLVAAASMLAWQEDSPLVPRDGGLADQGTAWPFFVLLVGAMLAYLAGLVLLRRGTVPLRPVLGIAIAVQLVPLAAPLLLSTDAWTYWSYGWVGSRGGGNPYTDAPQAFPDNPALPWMGSDWRDTTTVYGPAFTLASEPLAVIAGDSNEVAAWTYKALAAAAALGAALLAGLAWRARESLRGRARLVLAACHVLLTTPYLAVWYLAWTVPLVAVEEDRTATLLCLGLCAYLLPQTIPA